MPDAAGVYELSLIAMNNIYPLGESPIIYVGSTGRLRKRLLTHHNGQAHSEKLRTAISNSPLNFRWAKMKEPRACEAYLIQGFLTEFGSLPIYNSLKPSLK